MGPGQITVDRGLDVGPHPHIGLQTVTWLLEGAVLHRDSLGSEQLIRPGQLNLMTAGQGVSHAEETSGVASGALHGVQLWVAQPESTRHTEPAFEHHPVLPRTEAGDGVATVLVGRYLGAVSPARRDTDHVGVELELRPGRTALPLDATFEHALVVLAGGVAVDGRRLGPGRLGYLGVGRGEVTFDLDDPARLLLIGGVPLYEPLLMWWNYVARTRDEISDAHRAWTSGSMRFGSVRSPLARIDVAGPPWNR
jgi:hypothetical protein